MTPKRAPKKDPEFAAYVRARKKLYGDATFAEIFWTQGSGRIFRAGVAFGRRSKGK